MKTLRMRSKFVALVAVVAMAVFTVGCSKEDGATPGTTDVSGQKNGAPAPGNTPIAQIAINAGFNELVAALSYVDAELNTGLVDMFMNGTDQYTVFAPTDAAFNDLYAALSINSIEDLPAELVRDVLLYHVTNGRRAANSVLPKNGTKKINTLLGVSFTVDAQGMITAVGNTANITPSNNISASNGIIHVIDAVILPIN